MKDLYEQKDIWKKYRENIGKRLQTYYSEALILIPSTVQSILDIGCGEGSFLNMLQDKYQAVGLDVSITALQYATCEVAQGNSGTLPFKSKSFDLVTGLEILEHLKQDIFIDTIKEMKRVTKKYIIISVPNEEPLEYLLVVCPACGCHFNSVGHVRSFRPQSLKELFSSEFSLKKLRQTGNLVEYPTYNESLFSAIRSYIKPKPLKDSICPQCSYKIEREEQRISYSKMPASLRFFKKIADLIWRPRRKKYWLLALYEKKKKRPRKLICAL